jgi:hypothetical protein
MLMIVQATVTQSEEGRQIEWRHGGMPDEVRERFDKAVGGDDAEWHLRQIESRLGRPLRVGDRVAVSGELSSSGWDYGQVEATKEGMSLPEVLGLFDNERRVARLDNLLQNIVQHVAHCGQWDEGKPLTLTELRSYGYRCGCGWEVAFQTSLVVWAEHYSALLPTGFTEKMRFLAIRGSYFLSLALGTHEVIRQIKLDWPTPCKLLKPIPRCGGKLIYDAADFENLPDRLQSAKRILLTVPPIQGVVLTDRGDNDPLRTHVTVNCTTIEDADVQQDEEASEGPTGPEGGELRQDLWTDTIDKFIRGEAGSCTISRSGVTRITKPGAKREDFSIVHRDEEPEGKTLGRLRYGPDDPVEDPEA